MKGRGLDSQYIITRLFATDYFYYYSKPVLFAAYFSLLLHMVRIEHIWIQSLK